MIVEKQLAECDIMIFLLARWFLCYIRGLLQNPKRSFTHHCLTPQILWRWVHGIILSIT